MSGEDDHVLKIKHMVCPRCITVVREVLEKLPVSVKKVELGEALIGNSGDLSEETIDKKLRERGFELMYSRDQQRANDIKKSLSEYIQLLESSEDSPRLSDYLSGRLHQNYASLSSAFSNAEEITIEKYLIRLKIERVKELLDKQELTLSEIAWRLNYSSVAHLSGQFKQVTGLTPTEYQNS